MCVFVLSSATIPLGTAAQPMRDVIVAAVLDEHTCAALVVSVDVDDSIVSVVVDEIANALARRWTCRVDVVPHGLARLKFWFEIDA